MISSERSHLTAAGHMPFPSCDLLNCPGFSSQCIACRYVSLCETTALIVYHHAMYSFLAC